jgi:two-component system NtrC family response regulator
MTETETISLLLVDDEEKFLNTLTERLKLKYFDITPVTNGEAAIEAAGKAKI